MAKCYVTGKGTMEKKKKRQTIRATRRNWKANLQTVKIVDENGDVKRVKVSARALKKNNLTRA